MSSEVLLKMKMRTDRKDIVVLLSKDIFSSFFPQKKSPQNEYNWLLRSTSRTISFCLENIAIVLEVHFDGFMLLAQAVVK